MAGKTIYVYENWSFPAPTLMGCLYVESLRGKETCSFEYDPDWLIGHRGRVFIDPELQLYQGRQYAPVDRAMFGVFSDSCPDRWGRMLMRRREAILADREGRKPRQLQETDYLLGVHDEARMGALRFSLQADGPFLACDSDMAAPPWATLRELEAASLAFEQDEDLLNDRWLRQLLAPGSSLGGARPKATVKAADGSLWIAKFPSRHDEFNSGAWEQVAHELAKECGLQVPESRLERFSDTGSTFLVRRFDRDGNHRIHFSSAMALLGKADGASAETGSSYLDLAEFITAYGAFPRDDLRELWKRIVFSMAISNTDDHLRNHGFLMTQNGWRLSPMYDVNPVPYGETLSLGVTLDDARIDPGLAIEVAPFFGIKPQDADREIKQMFGTIKRLWNPIAEECGLTKPSIRAMTPAFSVCEQTDI